LQRKTLHPLSPAASFPYLKYFVTPRDSCDPEDATPFSFFRFNSGDYFPRGNCITLIFYPPLVKRSSRRRNTSENYEKEVLVRERTAPRIPSELLLGFKITFAGSLGRIPFRERLHSVIPPS